MVHVVERQSKWGRDKAQREAHGKILFEHNQAPHVGMWKRLTEQLLLQEVWRTGVRKAEPGNLAEGRATDCQ